MNKHGNESTHEGQQAFEDARSAEEAHLGKIALVEARALQHPDEEFLEHDKDEAHDLANEENDKRAIEEQMERDKAEWVEFRAEHEDDAHEAEPSNDADFGHMSEAQRHQMNLREQPAEFDDYQE